MIDTLYNLLFRCSHRRLTRPVTPVSKAGVPHGETYVVCLDCGKQFSYDIHQMKIGGPLHDSHETGVLDPGMPKSQAPKVKLALLASAIPLGMIIGSAIKRKPRRGPDKKGS